MVIPIPAIENVITRANQVLQQGGRKANAESASVAI
jgi:hypothetical protein